MELSILTARLYIDTSYSDSYYFIDVFMGLITAGVYGVDTNDVASIDSLFLAEVSFLFDFVTNLLDLKDLLLFKLLVDKDFWGLMLRLDIYLWKLNNYLLLID